MLPCKALPLVQCICPRALQHANSRSQYSNWTTRSTTWPTAALKRKKKHARYWWHHSEYSENTRANEGASFYWLLNTVSQAVPQPACTMCLCLLQLEWKLQTQTLVIQLWDNMAQSPEGYLDTENIQNNKLEETENETKAGGKKWERKPRGRWLWLCLCISFIEFIPLQRGLFMWFVEQNAAWWNSVTTTWQSICHLFSWSRLSWNGILIGIRNNVFFIYCLIQDYGKSGGQNLSHLVEQGCQNEHKLEDIHCWK